MPVEYPSALRRLRATGFAPGSGPGNQVDGAVFARSSPLPTTLGSREQLVRGVPGEEAFESLGGEVVEDSPLAFFPGLVQGAGGAHPADAVCHDAIGHAEGSLHGFHGLAERDPSCRSRQFGATVAALFAINQALVGERGQDAGQQAAWDMGLDRDPLRRHPLSGPGEVEQGPQRVPPLAAKLQPQTLVLLYTPTNRLVGLVPIVPGKVTGSAGFPQSDRYVACDPGRGRVKVVSV